MLRRIMVMAGGTALGQLVLVAAAPVLARLYGPDDFGALAVFTGVLAVGAVVAGFRYEWAIPLEKSDDDALAVMALSMLITCFVTLAAAVLVALAGDALADFSHSRALRGLLWLVPPGILLSGIYQALNFWCVRQARFSAIARTRTTQGLGSAACQLAFGFLRWGPSGLILGHIIGMSAGIGILLRSLAGRWRQLGRVGLQHLRLMWRRHIDLFRFNTPQALMNSVGQHIPSLFLAAWFSPAAAGMYLMAQRMLGIPAGLVDQAFRQVYYQQAVAEKDRGRLAAIALEWTFKLLALVALPALLVVGWGPELFVFFLGSQWHGAGTYAQYMVLWSAIGVVNIPANSLVPILNAHRFNLAYEVLYLLARLGVLGWGVRAGSAIGVVAGLALVGTAFNVLLIGFMLHWARKSDLGYQEGMDGANRLA